MKNEIHGVPNQVPKNLFSMDIAPNLEVREAPPELGGDRFLATSAEAVKNYLLATRIAKQEPIPLLDVRSLKEFSQMHIDGSCNVPLTDIEQNGLNGRFADQVIFAICASGYRTINAVLTINDEEKANNNGISRITICCFEGIMNEVWKESGLLKGEFVTIQ